MSLKLPAFAQSGLPDPQSVLDRISVDGYVREDYRKLYSMTNDPLWDPAKDWIRNVDWEKVRSDQAGKTVRFAIGAADQESAAEGLKPFEQLSGIKVELVPIPDDSFYDKAVAEFISGNASFDALQFFSPWLGDFAAPGFLAPLDDYAAKWKPATDRFIRYLSPELRLLRRQARRHSFRLRHPDGASAQVGHGEDPRRRHRPFEVGPDLRRADPYHRRSEQSWAAASPASASWPPAASGPRTPGSTSRPRPASSCSTISGTRSSTRMRA